MNQSPVAFPPAPLPATALAARQRGVENALLVQAFCGYRPGPAVRAQLPRYATGELSREQAFAALYQEPR